MNKIKTGIIGSAGYTGGELIRILLNHPHAKIVFAHSKSNAGRPVNTVHSDLLGETELKFSAAISENIDVLFLCVGNGEAKKFLSENKIPSRVKIIDLSNDHRLNQTAFDNQRWIYGLPELNREKIKTASSIANPGCFATAIQLALLPLACKNLLNAEVHVSATTGSTGAGHSLSETSHFSWRQNNIGIYKAFTHQHLGEIYQSLKQLHPSFSHAVNFIPHRGSYTRGIFAGVYTTCGIDSEAVKQIYRDFYSGHSFVFISESPIALKQVVNTNKCFLYLEKQENKLMIISIIDNLLKGASGQAIQNMNLMFGLDETSGLKLKASFF